MLDNRNAAIWFVDRHVEEGRGSNVAFREADGQRRSQTYAELAERSDLLAGAFESAGLRREERVACLILDQLEYPEIFWGALKAGVVPVALNTLLATSVYQATLDDSRAACLIVSPELWETVAPALVENKDLRKVIVIGGKTPPKTISYVDFLQPAKTKKAIFASDDECAFWLYSSGSTGQPKGVRHVHSALLATAETYGAQVLGIKENDVIFSAAKIFFAYGMGNALTFPMSVGATTILFSGRPTPDTVLDIIQAEQPTLFCGVPTLYGAIVALLQNREMPSHRVRLCISAGEALPADIGRRWQDLFKNEILDGVGSTEMLHIFLSNREGEVNYGTSGIAVPGYELRCVNEGGNQIQPGEVGEMLVKGGSSADGYWNQRTKNQATFEGEWTRTGDKYEIMADGTYIYCGRTDDMFKVSGIWLSPFEVEQTLISHPKVLEAAVVAQVDDHGLEKPKAFVVLNGNTSKNNIENELQDFVKERIGKWKYPRWIEIIDDLPKTATGKIQRFKLRSSK